MDFPFDTVITGAGISIDAPSELPGGDMLARTAWLSLFPEPELAAFREVCRDALPENADADNGLRLEYLLDILSEPVGLDPLVRVYDLLGGSHCNMNHRLIAALPAHRNFTLNMDTLLEQAVSESAADSPGGRHDIVHLHGRWDRPSTIKTTISQYLQQLPTDLGRRFVDSVADRNVLVMGYSGRDFDVFPELVAHQPRRLVWLMHPGSKLAVEVEAELGRLESRGCRVEYPQARVGDYLSGFVDGAAVARAVSLSWSGSQVGRSDGAPRVGDVGPGDSATDRGRSGGYATGVESALADVALSKRVLGAARVLFELGAFAELDALAAQKACVGADAALVRKVQARALRRRGHNWGALGLLVKPPTNRDAARVTLGNVNEVANLLTRVGVPALGRASDRALMRYGPRRESVSGRRFQLQASVRVGQDLCVRGRLEDAAALLSSVTDASDVRDVIGLSGQVDAMTWLLDALKALGRYEECVALVEQMESLAPYTNLSQRTYAYWQAGQVRLLTGDVEAAKASLMAASRIGEASSDRQALAWVVASRSDACRDDPPAGRAVLNEAMGDGRGVDEISHHYLARQYVLLQMGEQARVEGDLEEASKCVDAAAAVRAPGRFRVRRWSMNTLAVRMVRLLIDAEQVDGAVWVPGAEALRADYLRLGAVVAAADVSLVLHKVAGHPLPAAHPYAPEGSWQDSWLKEPWCWRRPWRVVA